MCAMQAIETGASCQGTGSTFNKIEEVLNPDFVNVPQFSLSEALQELEKLAEESELVQLTDFPPVVLQPVKEEEYVPTEIYAEDSPNADLRFEGRDDEI
jgi:hypothetical protein